MKKVLMLVSAALLLAGIAAIVASSAASRKASRANHWDQKRATVERLDGTNVAYRYEAGGSTHRVVSPARPHVTYTAGATVLAYVNPANPAEALLELPRRPPTWPAVAGGVALLVGLALGFWVWHEGRTNPAATAAPAAAPVAKKPGTKVSGDTTARRRQQQPPLARLQPPPPVKWKRADGETPSPEPPPPSPPDAPSGTRGTPR